MKPALGWTQLSQHDLRRVEDELAEAGLGVRDELGFLELHTVYADRFFPGTSVLLERVQAQRFASRLALGQPNQEDLADRIGDVAPDDVRAATLNLSPYFSS